MTTTSISFGDLGRVAARAADVVSHYGRARTSPDRIHAVSRATLIVENVRQELDSFTRFVYERDGRGRFIHLLPDGQIAPGVWMPWRGKSVLTRLQKDMLRSWLFLKAGNRLRPIYYWEPMPRRWYVDLAAYPTLPAALAWLERHELTAQEWLALRP